MKRGRLLLFAVLITLAGLNIAIPPYIAHRIEGILWNGVPECDDVRVRLTAFPAVRLLWGSIDTVEIVIVNPRLNGLQLNTFRVHGNDVQLDRQLLQTGTLVVTGADTLAVEAAFDEEALASYIRTKLHGVENVHVDLTPGIMRVHGVTELLGWPLHLSVEGTLRVVDATRLQFVPTGFSIDRHSIPQTLIEATALSWQWDLDLSGLPFPVQLETITLEQNHLVVRGTWVSR